MPRPALTYLLLKYLHVLGAIVILGTGTGIAFFMLMAHLSRDADFIGRTGSVVVQADKLFTATAVAIQPLTGYLLMRETGVPFSEGWMVASLVLYGVAGMFWLPVVWIQPLGTYAGFAMVLTLAIPLRAMYKLHDFITMRHLENMAKITLVTGLVVVYGYACEAFFGWYSGNEYERFMLKNRVYYGPYAWSYWALLVCNFIVPQILWSKKLRQNLVALFTVAMFVNVGMWLERFVIIVTSLHRDFLPSSWEMYYPTFWDFATLAGTIGLFVTLMFLFVRVLPMISIFEMRTLLPEAHPKSEPEEGAHK